MIIDKETDAQDTSDLLEFTAPYGLDMCRERLENRHQHYNLFYPSWSRRNTVRIWEENDNTYRFRLRRTGRHNFFDIVSPTSITKLVSPIPSGNQLSRVSFILRNLEISFV